MSDTQDLAEGFNGGLEHLIPRAHQMGVRMVELRRGYVEATVPMDGNGNHIGTMYAGVLFTVGEVLGGAIAAGSFDLSKVYPVVKDLKINFRRPATTGVTAKTSMTEEQIEELDAKAQAEGKAQFILTAELHDEAGELVAETEGTYQIRAHGS